MSESVLEEVARPRVFDAHLHIIDARFPLTPNRGFVPEPFTARDYRARTAGLDVAGGAVVSGSLQAHDHGYLHAALDELGPLAHRVAALVRWHVEVYVDGRDLPELEPRLAGLPRMVVDHLGLHRDGLPALLRLVEAGARVKASGLGRVHLDVGATLSAIAAVDPTALLFGTDLPGTRAPRAFTPAGIDVLVGTLGAERDAPCAARQRSGPVPTRMASSLMSCSPCVPPAEWPARRARAG